MVGGLGIKRGRDEEKGGLETDPREKHKQNMIDRSIERERERGGWMDRTLDRCKHGTDLYGSIVYTYTNHVYNDKVDEERERERRHDSTATATTNIYYIFY